MEDSDSSISIDGWECLMCSTENLCNDTHCQVCKVPRPRAPDDRGGSVPSPPPLVPPSSSQMWTCVQCTFENHRGDDVCRICGADRGLDQGTSGGAPSAPLQPAPAADPTPPLTRGVEAAAAVTPADTRHVDPLPASAAATDGSWECSQCTMVNESGTPVCEVCMMGTPAAVPVPDAGFAAAPPASPAEAAWVCGTCTLENAAGVSVCGVCETPRHAGVPGTPVAPSAPPVAAAAAGVAPTEWACAHCTVVNTAEVQVCGTCDLRSPGVGEAASAVAFTTRVMAPPQAFVTQAEAENRARQERDDAAAARALEAAEEAEEERRLAADEAAARALDAESAQQQHLELVRQERDALWAQSLQAAYDEEVMEGAQDEAMAAQLQDEEGCVRATCRFCDNTCAQPTERAGVEAPSCRSVECWRKDRVHCPALLGCGHPCVGTRGEQVHPQKCQHDDCCGEGNQDECAICFDVLTEFPCVQLGCGHVYHHPCLLRQIDSAKDSLVPGKQISFNLLGCPQCKVVMQADAIQDEMAPAAALVQKVDAEAKRVAEHERQKDLLALPQADFQRETRKLFMFFLCKEPGCGNVFCGGRQACADAGAAGQGDAGAAPAAVCPDCQLEEMARRGVGKPCLNNPQHPNENLVRKCNYCCDVATFCCNLNGPIYMCSACHSPPYNKRRNAAPCDPSKCAMRKLGKSYAQ